VPARARCAKCLKNLRNLRIYLFPPSLTSVRFFANLVHG
jgi:hypothetical protein